MKVSLSEWDALHKICGLEICYICKLKLNIFAEMCGSQGGYRLTIAPETYTACEKLSPILKLLTGFNYLDGGENKYSHCSKHFAAGLCQSLYRVVNKYAGLVTRHNLITVAAK